MLFHIVKLHKHFGSADFPLLIYNIQEGQELYLVIFRDRRSSSNSDRVRRYVAIKVLFNPVLPVNRVDTDYLYKTVGKGSVYFGQMRELRMTGSSISFPEMQNEYLAMKIGQ